jgi:hypothetical protein
MIVTEIVLGEVRFSVPRRFLIVCGLFEKDPSLLVRPYEVRSEVTPDALRAFLEVVQGHEIEMREDIREGFNSLSNEFGFSEVETPSVSRETQNSIDEFEEMLLEQGRGVASMMRDPTRISILESSVTILEPQIRLLSSEARRLGQQLEDVNASLQSGLEAIRNEMLSSVDRFRADFLLERVNNSTSIAKGRDPRVLALPSAEPPVAGALAIRTGSCDPNAVQVVKLLMLGQSGAGKTFMATCWSKGNCSGTVPTVGVDVFARNITVRGMAMNLQLWDSMGIEKWMQFLPSYIPMMDGMVLVYNMAWRTSFDEIPAWLKAARRVAEPRDPPVFLVAWNQRCQEAEVSAEEGRDMAECEGLFFTELYPDQSVIEVEIVKFVESAIDRIASAVTL